MREALKGAPLAINVPYGVSQVCHCLPDGDGLDIGEELGPGGEDCWVAFETFDIPWNALRVAGDGRRSAPAGPSRSRRPPPKRNPPCPSTAR